MLLIYSPKQQIKVGRMTVKPRDKVVYDLKSSVRKGPDGTPHIGPVEIAVPRATRTRSTARDTTITGLASLWATHPDTYSRLVFVPISNRCTVEYSAKRSTEAAASARKRAITEGVEKLRAKYLESGA